MIGRVYKIANSDESIVYIGSTTKTLEKRFGDHKRHYKRWIEGKERCNAMIFHHFRKDGIDNFHISLVSEHEVEERKQLNQFEQLVIDTTLCVNKLNAWRSPEEAKEMKRKYNINYNREHASETVECSCGKTYTRRHKARHERTAYHQQWS